MSHAVQEPPSRAVPTLRLLTYNVRSLRDDAAAVARVIRAADPHVVCIQEAPRLWRWRSACAALARRSGLVIVTGGATAAGNLIMCTLGVEVEAARDELFSRDRGLHQRGAALARLRWHDIGFAVAGTHLDLAPAPRLRHVGELEGVIASFAGPDRPVVIAGDINDLPGSPSWLALGTGRSDAFAAAGDGAGATYSASRPERRIDAVFVGAGLTPVTARVLDGPDVEVASDHCPVLVELKLR
jgi:endonuclease/exonuclease/phosphatase family metal-dependent hydrolase